MKNLLMTNVSKIKDSSPYIGNELSLNNRMEVEHILNDCTNTYLPISIENKATYKRVPIYRFVKRSARYSLIVFLSLFYSCIHEEMNPCPPLQIEIVVKDKNYSNVDNVPFEMRKDESLPFCDYVPTLYYSLRDVTTGEIVVETGVFPVTGDNPTYTAIFGNNLPLGKYALTVWGGLEDDSSLKDNSLSAVIHANQTQGKDIYLANEIIEYDGQDHSYPPVYLERVTGKLLIQVTNLPPTIRYSDITISQVYGEVNDEFKYSDAVDVKVENTWEAASEVVLSAIVAPSVGGVQPTIRLNLYDSEDRTTPVYTITIPNINTSNLILEANKLTALIVEYESEEEGFKIFVLFDDSWEQIHNLGIE